MDQRRKASWLNPTPKIQTRSFYESMGTKDAMFYFHAGMIRRDLGDFQVAREYLAFMRDTQLRACWIERSANLSSLRSCETSA